MNRCRKYWMLRRIACRKQRPHIIHLTIQTIKSLLKLTNSICICFQIELKHLSFCGQFCFWFGLIALTDRLQINLHLPISHTTVFYVLLICTWRFISGLSFWIYGLCLLIPTSLSPAPLIITSLRTNIIKTRIAISRALINHQLLKLDFLSIGRVSSQLEHFYLFLLLIYVYLIGIF